MKPYGEWKYSSIILDLGTSWSASRLGRFTLVEEPTAPIV
jgi:hypothetical protein